MNAVAFSFKIVVPRQPFIEKGRILPVRVNVNLEDGIYKVYNILGQHFTAVDVIRREKVKMSESDVIDGAVSELKALSNYVVKLIKLNGQEPKYIIGKMKSGFVLKIKESDVAVFVGDEYLASIRKEDLNNLEEGIRLTDYAGTEFILDEVIDISESKKSFVIIISNI